MSQDVLRIGVIGCGDYGRRHIRRFAGMPDVQVVALADPSEQAREKAQQALAEAGRCTVQSFAEYRRLLEVPMDAVCIASPDSQHVPQVLDALSAGLHVLCEKPLTLSIDDLERVIRARDDAGKVVCMTYQRRYDGAHRALRSEVLSGRWGKVLAISVYNAEDWITPNRGTWRHDPTHCPGGFFYDASGHQLDFVFWATGLHGEMVQAWKHRAGTPVPIRVWGHALLSGGVPMSFCFVGHADAWREQINIHCEGRDFFVENFKPGATAGKQSGEPFSLRGRVAALEPESQSDGVDAEFVRVVRGELPNPAPPEETRPVIQFTRAALRSADLGTPVYVGP